MNPRRILWIALTCFVVIFFYALIPVETYNAHVVLYSFAGGALLFVTLFQALGDFQALYEITDKANPGDEEVPGRKMAPFAVVPGIIFLIVLIFHQGTRKDEELSRNGVLAKGTVVGGKSTKSTRRFQTTTSYEINVTYYDSTSQAHTFETSVNGSEFNDLYEGAQVDVIYSRKHPSLARVVFDVNELTKYIKVANQQLNVTHLLAILDETVPQDSILKYLNSINYEWLPGKDEGLYINEKLDLALKVFPGNGELAFVERNNMYVIKPGEVHFEDGLTQNGFKKKEKTVEGKSETMYYNDSYTITTERKSGESNSNDFLSAKMYMIYHIFKNETD